MDFGNILSTVLDRSTKSDPFQKKKIPKYAYLVGAPVLNFPPISPLMIKSP